MRCRHLRLRDQDPDGRPEERVHRSTTTTTPSPAASRRDGLDGRRETARSTATRLTWTMNMTVPTNRRLSGRRRCCPPPGVGGAAVRGDRPSPEVAARRADAIARLRAADGPFVARRPGPRRHAGPDPRRSGRPRRSSSSRAWSSRPTRSPSGSSSSGTRGPTSSSTAASSPSGAASSTCSPAPRAARFALEYWGDEIESLREFSPSTQLSTTQLGVSRSAPVRELLARRRRPRCRAASARPHHLDRFRDGLQRLADGLRVRGHGDARAAPVRPPAHAGRAAARRLVGGRGPGPAHVRPRRADARGGGGAGRGARLAGAARCSSRSTTRSADHVRLTSPSSPRVSTSARGLGHGAGQPAELATPARAGCGRRLPTIVLVGRGHGSLERAAGGRRATFRRSAVEAPLAAGFVFEAGEARRRDRGGSCSAPAGTRGPRRGSRDARPDAVADELEPGDFAVHRIHGVGRYGGIVHRALAGAERDYLVLEYAGDDKLYVPSDQVGMVAQVPRRRCAAAAPPGRLGLGAGDGAGEARGARHGRRARPALLGPDVGARATRSAPTRRGSASSRTRSRSRRRATSSRAIDEVKGDMERPVPMDRLICGDVGYGKTEIAVRAAFKAVMDGKQVAVLVPTTLLAEQHFVTFSERFAPFPVKVAMLSRFLSPAQQKEVVADVAAGRVDVVIGTHRLLGARRVVQGPRAAGRRRGAAVRRRAQGAAEALRAHVDVLTMTATPIPRTLEMALTGIRQMSTVDTPPEDRQPVLTYVGSLRRGARARRRPPGAAPRGAGVLGPQPRRDDRPAGGLAAARAARGADRDRPRADGRGRARATDDALLGSGRGRPGVHDDHRVGPRRADANTLVVDRADMLGLAQLYQLRGRVGRSGERAFAYFFFPPAARADRGGARAARDDLRAPGARVRVPDRAAGPRDPRCREPARRRAARAHRGGGLRRLLPRSSSSPSPSSRASRSRRRRSSGSISRSARSCRRAGWRRSRSAWSCTGASPSPPITTRSDEIREETIDRYGAPPSRGRDALRDRVAPRDVRGPRHRGGLDVSRAGADPARRPGRRAPPRSRATGCPGRRTTRRSGR